MESKIPNHRGDVAKELGPCDSFLRISSRDPQGDLYDQCGGITEYVAAQSTEDAGRFPSEEAALKVMYLALRNVIAKWECPLHWKAALNRFTLLWEDRIQIVTRA